MQSSYLISLVALAAAVVAAPARRSCSPAPAAGVSPVLPSTGSTDLPSPAANATLRYIAVGHGIQNYTCANSSATAVNTGALAVLYDVTALYPGTPNTGLSNASWAAMTSAVLRNQSMPLNLANPSAVGLQASPNSTAAALSETSYNADAASPFPSPAADLDCGQGVKGSFLGHHFFDQLSAPTFNLSASPTSLFFSGKKVGAVAAPADADKGLLNTKAVDWLQLADNERGLSTGVVGLYRVVTAGGGAQACNVSGPSGNQTFSVPYTAEYWFYG